MRRVLRRPGVAALGTAGLLSEVGDWMLFIALPLYVLKLTGSPLLTATVFAIELVPTVVVGPLAGVVVDRLRRWRLMTAVAALQALCLLPLLAVDSAADLWLVYVVVVVESVLGTVVEPCRAVTAATLVPAADRMAINQLMAIFSSVARLLGGPIGGLVLGVGGIDAVLLTDAATFAAAAALFAVGGRGHTARPRRDAAAPGPRARARLGDEWRDGLRVVARSPVLRRTIGVFACAGLAQGAFVVLFVLFVVRDLGGSESDVGILRGVQAVGALAGGALLGLAARRLEPARLVAVSLAAFGVLSLITWNAPPVTTAFALYVGLFVAAGVPGLAAMTGLLTLVQSQCADAVRGRVMSTFFAVFGGVQALGMLLAGLVGTGAGLTVALQIQGALYIAAAALAARGASRSGLRGAAARGGRGARAWVDRRRRCAAAQRG
ncbi:MAG TPA: MFS transporter [Baekduia sp.]|uniref:MFS transporter n=1 Tax=Baekduia sp. TaxID=2600305 RepID=UPI002CFD5A47|nr:MFS transporter [Baekduia sp.]HMJ32437.1 MFS transporter [Baekduia sp.]